MNKIDLILRSYPFAKEIVKGISKKYRFIHRRAPAEINGIKGFFVWDYILYNEITFEDTDGEMFSFFTSFSDKETEAQWNELIEKYGI